MISFLRKALLRWRGRALFVLLRHSGLLPAQCSAGVINAVDHQAGAEYGQHYHQRHDFVGQEGEYAGLDKEPVVSPVIHRIAEGCPHKDQQNAHKFLPDLADIVDYIAVSQIQHAPAEQKSVVHEGLENDVAERRLTAKRRAGVAHPHQTGGNGESYHRLPDAGELGIKLDEGHQHRHDGADIKRQLVGADAVIAVGKGHDEKVDQIQSHCQIRHDNLKPVLILGGFPTCQRQRQRAAENNE